MLLRCFYITTEAHHILQLELHLQICYSGMVYTLLSKKKGIRQTNPIGTKRNKQLKREREIEKNSSKYRQTSNLDIGDNVLIRNYSHTKKFNPIFQLARSTVIAIESDGRTVTIETTNGQ